MRETIWLGSRYSLAALITTAAIAAVPCLASVAVGLIGFVVGIILTLVLPFGADPPIFGFVIGVSVVLVSVVGTIAAPLAILAIAFLLSCGVITPIALIIRFVFEKTRIKSSALAAAVFLLVGVILGLALGAFVHAVGIWAEWKIAQSMWGIIGFYATALVVAITATGIYGSVLISADAVRAGIGYILKRWFKKGVASPTMS